MLVASDTSPISNLAIIGRLNVLQAQFRQICIPSAVELEVRNLTHPSALADVGRAIKEGWIKLRAISTSASRVARLLESGLGPGEAEAIALAIELGADLILIDERDGRNAAERAGLKVTGVLGILLRAKRQSQIPALKPELEASRTRARFFVSSVLEEQVLRSAGE